MIQRDNLLFAKKLDKNLVSIAKEGDKHVSSNLDSFKLLQLYPFQAKSFDRLWTEKARRAVLKRIMDEWVAAQNKERTVGRLLGALSAPGFMDVKFRVERLLEQHFPN